MRANQFDVPIREVSWCSPKDIFKIECDENRVTVISNTEAGVKKIFISFPSGGGIRICVEKAGFFEPESLNKIHQTTQKNNPAFISSNGLSVCIKKNYDNFLLELASKKSGHTLQIDTTGILLGYDGNEWCKAGYKHTLSQQEGIYGFGERFNKLNHRGTHFSLWNQDCWSKGTAAYKNMPVFHSTNGYMMFFNSFYNCEADVGAEQQDIISLEFEGPEWDAYFFLDNPVENIQQYTNLTGKPILPPQWALRYWAGGAYQVWDEKKGPEHYLEAVEECLDGYRRLGIPDIAVLGGEGQPFNNQPAYEILKKTGTKMVGWNHPSLFISDMQKLLGIEQLSEIPYFMNPEDKTKQAEREVIDFAHPNASKVVGEFFKPFWEWGLKGCMVDYGEILPIESLSSNSMTGDQMHNFVSYWYNKAYHDAWTREMGSDHILFSRSGCAGCQRWVANFGGDQVSTFEGLSQAVNGMLNLTSCGFSLWGTDIGGYGGPPSSEVYIRWLQFGAFNPLMRAHGAGLDRDPWTYGDTAVKVFIKLYWLRENLLTFLYGSAVRSHIEGIPMIQTMASAFPDENIGGDVNGQYMFCETLMVCPVTEEGAKTKQVVFPAGIWHELFTGETITGGVSETVGAALDSIPVYIKEGSVIPLRIGDSGKMLEPVYAQSFTSACLITPCDKDINSQIVFGTDDNMGYHLSSDENGRFTLKFSKPVCFRLLYIYTCKTITKVTIDSTEISGENIISAQKGYRTVQLGFDQWKSITVFYTK